MMTALIIAAICLCAEMFFAASEISIISCNRVALRKAAADGHRASQLLENFLDNKQRLLATTLTGTQLSVVLSTVVMTYALHHYYPAHAGLYLLVGLTPVLIVFGEIVPKTLGQQHADAFARRLVYPLWLVSSALRPLVFLLTRFTLWLTRVLGIAERKIVTREELELMLQGPNNASDASEITEGERTMISRIFQFTDKTAHDVMVPLSDVVALSADESLSDAAREVDEKQYTRFPVYRERVDQIIGIVHAFDVLKAGTDKRTIGDIARPPIFAPTTQKAVDLLVELQRSRLGMAIIVDEYGGAVGISTIEDILEEVVGQIDDEHDTEQLRIRREAEGLYRVSARTGVAELNRHLKVELPEGEEYESIAGLLLDRLRHIPREGESVRFGDVVIRVMRATPRAVEEVQVRVGKRRTLPPRL